jgi:hypothetical protein
MRGVAMTYAIVAALAAGSAALAQNNADQPSASGGSAQTTGRANSGTGQPTNVREAPIGHRQPTAKDVPPRNEQLCCWLRRIAAAMQHYRGA